MSSMPISNASKAHRFLIMILIITVSIVTLLQLYTLLFSASPVLAETITLVKQSSKRSLPEKNPLADNEKSLNELIITSTHYVDEIRTNLLHSVSQGNNVITLVSTTGFTAGQEILVITMQGEDVGQYETQYISDVINSNVHLATPLLQSYDTSISTVMIQVIPHYSNIMVENGGILTAHNWDGQTGGVLFLRADSITIQSTGAINMSGKGYRGGKTDNINQIQFSYAGEGYIGDLNERNQVTNSCGGGGGLSHKGQFFEWSTGSGGGGGHLDDGQNGLEEFEGSGVYGFGGRKYISNNSDLLTMGCGGGTGGHDIEVDGRYGGAGGNGGGIIFISTDFLVLKQNSYLGAEGLSGLQGVAGYKGGGGAGGSIFLQARAFQIDGSYISAVGGNSYELNGNGGRGRIRIDALTITGSIPSPEPYITTLWGDEIIAHSSISFTSPSSAYGNGSNTITAVVTIRNQEELLSGIPISSVSTSNTHINVTAPNGFTTNQEGQVQLEFTAVVTTYQPLTAEVLVELQTAAPITLPQKPTITFIPSALTINENQTWTAETVMAQMLVLTEDATIEWLHPQPQLLVNSLIITDHASLVLNNTAVISSQNIIIGPNATISVTGIYSGSGRGQDATAIDSSGSGAGHGGTGGNTSCCTGGVVYDDIYQPLEPGSSGGATYSSTLSGGSGGGAIHFVVSNQFDIFGQITVNGADGQTDNNVSSGGGSGGSILISAENGAFNLYDAGKLSATGGQSQYGGGGGGGRIAIYANTYNTQGSIDVRGGAGNQDGQDGTVYLDLVDFEQSTIEVDRQNTYTSQFTGSTITITILSKNGEPVSGQPIDLMIEGPGVLYAGTQEISNTTTYIGRTNEQGVLTTTLRTITSGIYEFLAYASPTTLQLAQSKLVTFTDAIINPTTSTFELSQGIVPANNISHALAIVTLYNVNGSPIINKDVQINSNGTDVTVFPPHPITDQNGQAMAMIYTADVQTVVLTATVDSQMLTHHPILTFAADAPSQLHSTITISPAQTTADGEDILTIEAYLKDEQNRPLVNRAIQLSAPSVTIQTANPQISDESGRVIFTLTSTNIGTQTVYLEDLFTTTTLSATVQFVPGTPDKDVSSINIDPTQLPADGLTTAVVTTIIQDSVGHPLLNETVTITSTANNLTINQPYTQTNAAGIVTATIQSAEIQTATLQALIGLEETPLSQTAVVYFQPTQPDHVASTTSITPTTATANGIDTITITGQLTDTFGRPFAHMPLQLTISGQTNTIIPTATQSTNSAGQFSFTLTSTTAETKAITLTDTIYGTKFALGTVEFLPSTVDRAKSTVEYVNPYPVAYANGHETIDLLVTARDANGNPVPNAAVQLDITTGTIPNPVVIIQPSTTTDANGQLSIALQSDIPTAARIWVIIDNKLINQFVEVDFAFADPHQSTLTVIGNESATADGQELIQLSVTARSTDGTPLTGANVTLTSTAAALGEITLIQPHTPTNANGRTSGYASSTIDGHALVYANIDGIALPTPVTITFKGPDLALQLHAPDSLMAGFPLAYELTVENKSGFDATNIVFTETLPAGTVFNTASPAFTYITDTHQLVGTLSYLTAGAAAVFTSTVQIPHQQTVPATLSALGTMAEQEANLSNNATTLTTTITPPAPVLVLETPYPTAAVEQNLTGIISVTLRNDGSLPLTNTTLSLIDTFPWITANTNTFSIPPYGQTQTIILTAAPDQFVSPANYLSTAALSAANYPTQALTIDVRVQAPTRPLVIYTQNQGNEPITNTLVTVKDTQNIFAPTAVYTHTNTQNTFTNENGFATFLDLESGRSYEVTAAANGYNKMQPLTFILPEGELPFTQTITLTSIPQLVVEPAQIHLLTQPNQIAQETISLRNVGVTPITSLSIEAPHDTIDFAFLGQAGYLPHLDPGEVISFSFNIAPPLTTSLGVYEDVLQITGDDDLFLEVPVTAYIHDIQDSNLCVIVMSELLNTPLADVTVIVSEESGRGPDSFQQKHTTLTDESGQACFIEIPTGPYKIDVMWNGSLVVTKHIELAYEETRPVQVEYIWVTAPSVEVDWTVTPIALTDQYTTTMTLSFIPDGVPSLATSPQRIRLCDEDNGIITETVTIHNFYPVQFTNVRVGLGYLADQGDITAELIDPITLNRVPEGGLLHIGNIDPDADKELLLRAHLTNNNTCSNESGTVFLRTFADYAHYLPNSWYGVEPSADMIPLGETASVPLKLAHTGYPEESNLNTSPLPLENVTLTPPRTLDWMTVSRKLFPVINHEDFVTFTLDVSAPEWLPQGVYRDYILITATNGITAVIGIEAERTAYGLELETRFVTPLNTQSDLPPGGEEELALNYFSGVTQQYGGDKTIRGTTSFVNNTWPLYLSCKTDCTEQSFVKRHANQLELVTIGRIPESITYAAEGHFEKRLIILELSQQFTLEREAFLAQLHLRNGLPVPLKDITVDITISDRLGELSEEVIIRSPNTPIEQTKPFALNMPSEAIFSGALTSIPETWMQSSLTNFIMVPDTTTSLPDIQAHGNYMATWTIVPDAIGIVDPRGVDFYLKATINYTPDGQFPAPSIETVPAKITVRPQPLVILDYFLPTYVLGGETFNWTVIVTNVGQGVARNLNIHTPQPIIVDALGDPVNFTILGAQNHQLLELEPGESHELIFQIRPEENGAFAGAHANCEQQNYQGVTLPPLLYCSPTIHWLDTSYLYYAHQQTLAKEGCFTTLHQAFMGDPVNTYSGNFTLPVTDVSIPTWGLPLQFERTYNALTQDDPGPLGQGWTHNYHASIEYRPYISRNEAGELISENLLSARLPHGSRIYFTVNQNGDISPMPGVRAQLTEELGVYTLTQECDQTTYIFENKTFTNPYARPDAVLTAIIDADGNTTTFTYDPDEGNLTSVIAPSGRELTFTYTQQDDHWYLEAMTDPLGRLWEYAYTNGYLTAVTTPDGRTTTYTYTDPADERPGYLSTITDPTGQQTLHNNYDAHGRVIWQTDALNAPTTFIYTQNPTTTEKFTHIVDPLGRVTIETYNPAGALVTRQDPLGYSETFSYDEHFNLIAQTDKSGGTTTYAWTDCHCDMSVITDTLGYTITMSYDEQRRMTTITDRNGYLTQLNYGRFTNPTTITDPLGASTTYTYNTHGTLTTVQAPLVGASPSPLVGASPSPLVGASPAPAATATTSYGYDPYGNMTVVTDTLGHLSRMAYDAAGRLISTTNPLGHTTVFTYDVQNNLIAMSNADGVTTMSYDPLGNMIALQDPLGRVTTYTYNPRSELIQVTDALSGTQHMGYDLVGNLISETNQLGHTTTYHYDDLNRLIAITNPLSGTTSYLYDPLGRLLAETDANGATTTYTYVGNTITTIFADGSQMQATYDAAGNLTQLVDAANRTVTYQYDPLGRLLTETDPLGRVTHYTYDAAGNLTSSTNAAGYTTTYQYDALNRLIATTNPLSGTVTMQYDALGNQTALTDALGRTWAYRYDAHNRLTRATNPFGETTQYQYDAVGNPTQLIDPLGRVTHTTYDALNRPTIITNPLGHPVSYIYDAAHRVTAITDADGRTTTYQYDALGRAVAVTNPLSQTTTFTYDAIGNQLAHTDAAGRTTFYTYDLLGQQTSTIDPLGHSTLYGYDAVGNLTTYTDALGRATTYSYNPLDQVTAVTNPLGDVMTIAYDLLNRPLTQTDFAGHTTRYQYDPLGRTLAITNALGHATTFTYDSVGNLLTTTDPRGATTTYQYDNLDRPITITDPLSTTTTFTYDAASNQTATTVRAPLVGAPTALLADASAGTRPAATANNTSNTGLTISSSVRAPLVGAPPETADTRPAATAGASSSTAQTTTFTYDDLNRLTTTTDPLGYTTIYTYNTAGNLTTVQNPAGHLTHYSYDPLNRLTEQTNPLGHTTQFTYDVAGNQTAVTDPLGRTVYFTYDALNRPLEINAPLGRTTRYTYDAVGNQTTLVRAPLVGAPTTPLVGAPSETAGTRPAATAGDSSTTAQTTTFTYDNLNRLTAVSDPLGNLTTYSYDPLGNPLTITDPLGRVIAYTYDALSNPVAITDPLGQQTSYSYDAAGNQTALTNAAGDTTQFDYDPLGRLIRITDPLSGTLAFTFDHLGNLQTTTDAEGRTTTYDYDPLGRLTTTTDPLGQNTRYRYDSLGNLIATTDALNHTTTYQYDPLGRVIRINNPLPDATRFTYDAVGNLTQQTDPLGRVTQYTLDDLNQVTAVTDPLGNQIHYSYDPFGNLTTITDGNGHSAQLTYDPLGRLTATTNALGHTTRYAYDAAGQNTSVTDPLGFQTHFTYDNLGRLLTITDPLSRTAAYLYDPLGNPLETIDANGTRTRYSYDPLNRLTAVTENYLPTLPSDSSTNITHQFAYDRVGNLLAMTNPLGNTFTFGYDAHNRMTHTADPLGNSYRYTFDPVGNLTHMVDANNQSTQLSYDELSRVTTITRPDETISFTYDKVGNRLTMNDNSGQTRYVYDELDRLTQMTDPRSQIVGYSYDAVGNRTQLSYPSGQVVTYTYDAIDRLTEVSDWSGGQTNYTYDGNGRVTQVAYPNSVMGLFGYDDAHQLTDITYTHLTHTLAAYTYTYDALGNRTQAIERVATPSELPIADFTAAPRVGVAPLVVTFTNEAVNAKAIHWAFGDGATSTANAKQVTHTYNEAGTYTVTLTAAGDEFTHVLTRTGYIVVLPDETTIANEGLLVVEAESYSQNLLPAAHYWTSGTELLGFSGENYLQVMPDTGTLFEFNTTPPPTSTTHRAYLPLVTTQQPTTADQSASQIAAIKEAPELLYEVYFNEAGRYTVWVRGAAVDANSNSVHIGLSDEQHVALTGFAINEWRWSATTLAEPSATTLAEPSAATLAEQTAVLEIPAAGSYTLHVWAREDGFQFDRLILSNDPTFVPTGTGPQVSQRAKSYSGRYAAQAHLTQQQYSYADAQLVSDLQTFTIWNTLLANLGMLFTAPLGLLLPWAYRTRRKKLAQYMVMSALGLAFVTSGAGLVWGATPTASINTAANQTVTLPTAALPTQSAGLPLNIINYHYDPLGRLTEASHNDGTRFGYTYDAVGNRLTATVQPSLVGASAQTDTYTYDAANRLTGRNGTPFTYDPNGNLLNDGEFSYSYDSANRLKTMQDVAAVSLTSYAYNGDGVRVLQNMDGIDTHYVQDVAAAMPRVLASEEGGTLNLSLWGVGLIGEERGGTGANALPAQWQFNLPDALGSIRQVTDAAGGLALSRSYDPFGNLLSSAGDDTTPYGFAGEEQGASGHLYLRARTYDPAVGRFLQQDTVFGNPANPRTLHRYAYGFNNPVNYTDPSGRMPTQGGHALPMQNTAARSASLAAPAAAAADGATRGQLVDARTAALSKGQFESIQGSSCFLDGILGFLQETALELLDFATHTVKMLESLFNMVRDPSNWRHHLDQAAAHGKEAHNFLKEHKTAIAQILISLTPLDTMSDIFTFVTGYDVWTGEKVSWQERVMAGVFAAFDIFTGGFGDDLLQATQTMAKMAGAAKGTVKFAGKMAKGIVSGVGNLLVRGVRGLLDMGANLGRMVLKGADDLMQVMRRSAGDLLDVGRHQIDELDDLGRGVLKGSDNATLVVDSGQEAVARASRHVDTNGRWVNDVANGPTCDIDNSFTAETTVETDEGAKPIEDIAIGDRVLGEDPLTGEQGYFEVVALTDHPTDQIIQVIIQVGDDSQPDDEDSEQPAEEDDAAEDDEEDHSQTGRVEVMNVTPEHPIYVEGDGWIHANNLEAGDRLRLADGGMAKVLAIDQPDLDAPASVYNFTVRGPHTYFVLRMQLLVHNCGFYMEAKQDLDVDIGDDYVNHDVVYGTHNNDLQAYSQPVGNGSHLNSPGREIDTSHQTVNEVTLHANAQQDSRLSTKNDFNGGDIVGGNKQIQRTEEMALTSRLTATQNETELFQNNQNIYIRTNSMTAGNKIGGHKYQSSSALHLKSDDLKHVASQGSPDDIVLGAHIRGHYLSAPVIHVYSPNPPPISQFRSAAADKLNFIDDFKLRVKNFVVGRQIDGSFVHSDEAIHFVGEVPSGTFFNGTVIWHPTPP